MTNDLVERVSQHKSAEIPGFTAKYGVQNLVYYDQTNDVMSAIAREKQIKEWHRSWKIKLIEQNNPEWRDLYYDLIS